MPLVSSILVSEIRKISDLEFSGHEGFPKTNNEAASRWASAFDVYASQVIPASVSSSVAKAAMRVALTGLINSANPASLEIGMNAYATALAVGMAPVFVAIPPPAPLVLTSAFAIGLAEGSAVDVANSMASLIDVWMKTGTATPSVGGSPIPWS